MLAGGRELIPDHQLYNLTSNLTQIGVEHSPKNSCWHATLQAPPLAIVSGQWLFDCPTKLPWVTPVKRIRNSTMKDPNTHWVTHKKTLSLHRNLMSNISERNVWSC